MARIILIPATFKAGLPCCLPTGNLFGLCVGPMQGARSPDGRSWRSGQFGRSFCSQGSVYAAGESGMTRTEICSRFDITGVSLDEILEIVSTLADRESGARIICECRGERVVLTGDAGRVLPLRLSAAEVEH